MRKKRYLCIVKEKKKDMTPNEKKTLATRVKNDLIERGVFAQLHTYLPYNVLERLSRDIERAIERCAK